MTREEAIRRMKCCRNFLVNNYSDMGEPNVTAFNMAIKALEQEPCEDAISRADVRHLIAEIKRKSLYSISSKVFEKLYNGIDDLPPVNPQEPKYCDRNICVSNEYNGIGCNECEVTKSQELKTDSWSIKDIADTLARHGLTVPIVVQEAKTGHCKDCKYFEYDSLVKADGIPLIVAHEICSKWGGGCKTREDGYCFLFEPQESDNCN